MMKIFSIPPVTLTTVGGYEATVTGYCKSSSDCISGSIGGKDVSWDIHGRCRDNRDAFNFDTRTPEFQALEAIVRKEVPSKYLS